MSDRPSEDVWSSVRPTVPGTYWLKDKATGEEKVFHYLGYPSREGTMLTAEIADKKLFGPRVLSPSELHKQADLVREQAAEIARFNERNDKQDAEIQELCGDIRDLQKQISKLTEEIIGDG